MFKLKFIKVPTVDGRDIAVNHLLVEAIEDKGETIKIALGGKWMELNMTVEQFIDKCNEDVESQEEAED